LGRQGRIAGIGGLLEFRAESTRETSERGGQLHAPGATGTRAGWRGV